MDPLHTAILELDRRQALFAPGESLLVGCSGGADSMALVHALKALADTRGYRVHVAYVHHGLRPEADQEAERLAATMALWQLPFEVARVTVRPRGQGPEEAARDARYVALNELAASYGATALALGHHADDQLETVLLRLVKGAALLGLLGIPLTRKQAHGPRIVRPLLGTSRQAIEAYLERHGIAWFEDATNQDVDVPRNRIRHQVVPHLRSLNPAMHRTLAANLAVLADEHALLERLAAEALEKLGRFSRPGLLGWDAAGFLELPSALQRRVLALAYQHVRGTRRDLSAQRIERMRAQLGQGGGPHDVGSGLRVQSQYGFHLLDRAVAPVASVPARLGASVPGFGVRLEAASAEAVTDEQRAVVFDADALPVDLVWREARPERDRFTPWGHQNAHPLGHYLAKARIPRLVRPRLVVLASGNDVLWVVGMKRGAQAPIRSASLSAIRALREGRAWFDNAWSAPYHEADS